MLTELPNELLLMVIQSTLSHGLPHGEIQPSASKSDGAQCAVGAESLVSLSAVNRQLRRLVLPYLWEHAPWALYDVRDRTPSIDAKAIRGKDGIQIRPFICEHCSQDLVPTSNVCKLPRNVWHEIRHLHVMVPDFHVLLQLFCEARFMEQYSSVQVGNQMDTADTRFSNPYVRPPDSLRYLTIWNDNLDRRSAKTVICHVLMGSSVHAPDIPMAEKSWREMLKLMPPVQTIRLRRKGQLEIDVGQMVKILDWDDRLLQSLPRADLPLYLRESDLHIEEIIRHEISSRKTRTLIWAPANGIPVKLVLPPAHSTSKTDRLTEAPMARVTPALPKATLPPLSIPSFDYPTPWASTNEATFTASPTAMFRRWRALK